MDTGKLKIEFSTDITGTAYSVYKSCGWLIKGLYQKNGFIPASRHFLKCPRAIGFPKIDYMACKNFWERVKRYKIDSLPKDKRILRFLSKNIDVFLYKGRMDKHKKKLDDFWKKNGSKFYRFLCELYPEFKTKTLMINIFSVPYGSLCGFASVQNISKEKLEGYVYLRIDMPEDQLIEGIFSALLSKSLLKKYSWSQKEAIIDYLVERFFKSINLKKKFFETTKIIENQEINKSLLENSKRFVEKLQIPLNSPFRIKKGDIYFYGKKLNQVYMPVEKKILKSFLQKDDHVLSYDEIGDAIWNDKSGKNFSLWAINKRIHRLRNKLAKEGMPRSALMTVRGVGYYLNN